MSLLGARDALTLITVLSPGSSDVDAQALLSGFSDVIANHQITRQIVRQVRARARVLTPRCAASHVWCLQLRCAAIDARL